MNWLMEHWVSLAATLIALFALCESRKANKNSENANKLSREANELSKKKFNESIKLENNKLKESIIEKLIAEWKKVGQGETTLKNEWEIYKDRLTMQDFNEIWEAVWQRYKSKKPPAPADKLLNP